MCCLIIYFMALLRLAYILRVGVAAVMSLSGAGRCLVKLFYVVWLKLWVKA